MRNLSGSDNSGPAFPVTLEDGSCYIGLSMRDWFAGQALSGLLAESNHSLGLPVSSVVSAAYLYADEMIAQRQGGKSSD